MMSADCPFTVQSASSVLGKSAKALPERAATGRFELIGRPVLCIVGLFGCFTSYFDITKGKVKSGCVMSYVAAFAISGSRDKIRRVKIEVHHVIHSDPQLLAALTQIAKEINLMSARLNENLNAIADAIATEIQQLTEAVTAAGANAEAVEAVNQANARLEPLIAALRADDPTPPAPPAE